MFDFSKIGMKPTYSSNFEPPATEDQIAELERYCGHSLPENYKIILRNYNAGSPEAKYFDAIDEETGVLLEWKLHNFYILDDDKEIPANIWWVIENYQDIMGPNTIPFADDGLQQIYYMKWVNNVPQVWFLTYLDLEEPETHFVINSFDELLDALYVAN
ncbi:SMI1/KNR4 family protein [Legionella drozanskii]|uniref:SMI1 / KNR4 family protein n=1 Tax=Legionella drozanskii LLAP-1 TaxID=1212489 RepID=A0A0W0SLW7_9GAMM|nr:SMI1/KNR4 family protein [Legionella drozanskii]KTC84358.1 SMI1 / KNR4 family protein [Legionella drozanskii LLAP-1]